MVAAPVVNDLVAEPVRDPLPDGGPPRRVRLYHSPTGDGLGWLFAFPLIIVPPLVIGTGLGWSATAQMAAVVAFTWFVTSLSWLGHQLRNRFLIEIHTDRLRVFSTGRSGYARHHAPHRGWTEYPRDTVNSVAVQDGWLTITDLHDATVVRHRTGINAGRLRRALERNYWC